MRLLVIGNGAREHAIVWKLASSPLVKSIFVSPGNAGTARIATNLPVNPSDIETLIQRASELKIDMAVIGPEVPLAAGIVDRFKEKGIPAFGPTKQAAQIESSKIFAKYLMQKYGIPCAASRAFSNYDDARKYLTTVELPVVIKADGLAAGKGVIVSATEDEAHDALKSMMIDRIFGEAGTRVIIEEYLQGLEVSLLAFTDGISVIPMVPACDYKRVYDNDCGPNTGGMGSYSPPGFFDQKMIKNVTETIIKPAVKAMSNEGKPYAGVLYTGLIITEKGPKVLEFNARFGDPETQVILPRLKTDLVEIMVAVVDGKLDRTRIAWTQEACVGVVMASQGYPGKYRTGLPITISKKISKDINIFFAGAKSTDDGQILTDGGRVLTVTATGKSLKDARDKVYSNIPYIHFDGCYYRKDIAAREVS